MQQYWSLEKHFSNMWSTEIRLVVELVYQPNFWIFDWDRCIIHFNLFLSYQLVYSFCTNILILDFLFLLQKKYSIFSNINVINAIAIPIPSNINGNIRCWNFRTVRPCSHLCSLCPSSRLIKPAWKIFSWSYY